MQSLPRSVRGAAACAEGAAYAKNAATTSAPAPTVAPNAARRAALRYHVRRNIGRPCTSEIETTPIVLGLYRHDLREEDTLRRLLNWLRDYSFVESAINSQSSLEDAKDLLRKLQVQECFGEAWHDVQRLRKLLTEMPASPRMDDALIERVARNDLVPYRVRLRLFHQCYSHVGLCRVQVGYTDERPDDFRSEGRRLIQISSLPSDWLVPTPGAPPRDAVAADQLKTLLLKTFAEFIAVICGSIRMDYACIRSGTPLATPRTLKSSQNPLDFDQLYLPMPAVEAQAVQKEFTATEDWSLERVGGWPLNFTPHGFLVRFHGDPNRVSEQGRTLMERVRKILGERF